MTPLFAEVDPATAALYSAITLLLMAAANWLQSVIRDRKDARVAKVKEAADKKLAAEKAAADKKVLEDTAKTLAAATQRTTQALTDKVDDVHKAVGPPNGKGMVEKLDVVLEELKTVRAWQTTHEKEDLDRHDYANRRYDDTIAEVLKLKFPAAAVELPGKPPPPA